MMMPDEWRVMVNEILARLVPGKQVVLFGSRAGGSPKPYSDIDLCIMGDTSVPSNTMSALRIAFADSNLPVRVDIADWATTNPEFQKIIGANNEIIFGE